MMYTHYRHSKNESGFTIIELMIATLVFSVILTIITMGVLSFTNRYYRGVHESATQNTTRSIIDTISQGIQFGSSGQPDISNLASGYFCVGGSVYMFNTTATKFTGNTATQTGMYVTPMTSDFCQMQPFTGGKQLMGNNMRITYLDVTASTVPDTYTVSLTLAYGDAEQFCAKSLPSGCSPNAMYSDANFVGRQDVACKPVSGSQYCAVSRLTTTAQKRVQ
ncbi:type II secretion system protein [Candidatus Saccharibacteria bacterium]|nr:type II secretion system protein [Candidatus Saccharibacteria bacterium]